MQVNEWLSFQMRSGHECARVVHAASLVASFEGTLQLAEEIIQLRPVLWCHCEFTVLAGLYVLDASQYGLPKTSWVRILTTSKSSNLSRQFSQ